jgi:hypothetical protein
VRFACQTVQPTPLALKTQALGLAQTDPIGSAPGTCGAGLLGSGIQVMSSPGRMSRESKLMRGAWSAFALRLAQRRTCRLARLYSSTWKGSGLLPFRTFPHRTQASQAFAEQGSGEVASRLTLPMQMLCWLAIGEAPAIPGGMWVCFSAFRQLVSCGSSSLLIISFTLKECNRHEKSVSYDKIHAEHEV